MVATDSRSPQMADGAKSSGHQSQKGRENIGQYTFSGHQSQKGRENIGQYTYSGHQSQKGREYSYNGRPSQQGRENIPITGTNRRRGERIDL
eukprot:1196328-Prorocentrum_minimum.AAC.5